tara:strand:- start:312 stop:1106 length:795 start_codon:yes stop_codon:yes gene_type:complete
VSEECSVAPEKASAIIEAILLTADAPVTPGRLVALLDEYNGRDIRELVDSLNAGYADGGHGFSIVEVAGGFQLATRHECGPWLRKFHNDSNQIRLSQAALESLAIVAFKQPVTRIEVDTIRGVNSAGVIQTLMELSMIRIVGRSEGIGKPMLFGTTREFLVHFGLKTLADLPKPRELEELLESGENKAEARQQMAMELQELQGRAEGQLDSEDSDQPASGAEYVDADLQDNVAVDASEGTKDLGQEEDIETDSRHGENFDGNDA